MLSLSHALLVLFSSDLFIFKVFLSHLFFLSHFAFSLIFLRLVLSLVEIIHSHASSISYSSSYLNFSSLSLCFFCLRHYGAHWEIRRKDNKKINQKRRGRRKSTLENFVVDVWDVFSAENSISYGLEKWSGMKIVIFTRYYNILSLLVYLTHI